MRRIWVGISLLLLSPVFGRAQEGLPGKDGGARSLVEPPRLTQEEKARRMTPVARAVSKAAPAVINVYVKIGQGPRRDVPFGTEQTFFLEGEGSGVLIDRSGLALTNWHVIATALDAQSKPKMDHRVEVTLRSGQVYVADVLSASKKHDLALLRLHVPAKAHLPFIELGDSESLAIGETVIAIGNPFGRANTVTAGVLSSKRRTIRLRMPDSRVRRYDDLLQTDAAINPGNSGGALIDINGRLVGINNAAAKNVPGIGYAIAVKTIRKVFREELLSGDKVGSVYLGLTLSDHDGSTRIATILPGGPAARVGLAVGDRVLRARGMAISSKVDFARALLSARAGEAVTLLVGRGEDELSLQPVPMSHAAWQIIRHTGLELGRITFHDEPELLRTASTMLHRVYSGDENGRPSHYMESALRVLRLYPEFGDQQLGVGDLLLGVEVTVKGMHFDRKKLVTFEDLQRAESVLRNLAKEESGSYPCYLLRQGKVITAALVVAKL